MQTQAVENDESEDDNLQQIKGVESIVTPLFDPLDFENEQKINALIRHNFEGQQVTVPNALKAYASVVPLVDMLDFRSVGFDKALQMAGFSDVIKTYSEKCDIKSLENLAPLVTDKISYSEISSTDYVTTDTMLKDRKGIIDFDGSAQVDRITAYQKGDILVSNIRPYLKKIWLADKNGGCSNDILVFRVADEEKILPLFLYGLLKTEYYIEFIEKLKMGSRTTAQPNFNAKKYGNFEVIIPPISLQEEFAQFVDNIFDRQKASQVRIRNLKIHAKQIWDKYFG